MAENLNEPTVEGKMNGSVVVLTLKYDEGALNNQAERENLPSKVRKKYLEMVGTRTTPASCVLVIDASEAGTPLNRAIFDLRQEVQKHKGKLFCAQYPKAYWQGLIASQLLRLPDLSFEADEQAALSKARAGGTP